ncbi:fosfomycin resistance glutathione transferase [Endozoicomonas sp. SM1973]|uniref:Fosfomycin resistance glutathione transferase n=1 Tax=Spartinivicinus marinus TaxID=2994442 RepID=A0A853HRH3_9GAMM|nr:fosfomycin resistance glutathione transferase [Spartinivicinus marinus]NYZ64400.1 fosfomycin resistance glutathione transferase [Spartinivicinus marinus]
MINGINHITLAVNNLDKPFEFYVKVLGFKPHAKWNKGAYLSVGELWFCLSVDHAQPSKDYTHIAFDVSEQDFPVLKDRLIAMGVRQWKVNTSEGSSLYILDPDGHKLEIHVGSLQSRLDALKNNPYPGLELY